MSGTSAARSILQADAAGADALMAECDRMEAALGAWLARRAAHLVARRDSRGARCRPTRALRPSLWRALIQIWAISPEARATFSSEARGGLVSATNSMDARTLMALVNGLVEDSPVEVGPAAA
jgi:hypothetical protein